MSGGGVVLESHSCDFFPERWFDLVVVLRSDNTVLFDRLAARGYPKRKLDENHLDGRLALTGCYQCSGCDLAPGKDL
ncbi:MAG: AAA family ATPase [Methanothrix sp.]|nr:AAA family ATPase [Methanothrix sp.]